MEKTGKVCTKCGKFKSYDEFYERKSSKDGYRTECKKCILADRKQYQQTNKKSIAEQKRQYRIKNKERLNKINREYIKANYEKISEQRKQHYRNNSEKFRLYRKQNKKQIDQYYQDNKERIAIRNKKYRLANKEKIAIRSKLSIQNNANYKTYHHQLTIDEAPRLHKNNISLEVKCRYCGKYFIPTKLQTINRIQSLKNQVNGENSLYCSEGCKEACPIFKKVLYPKGFKKASSREVNPLVRQMCFERDDWKCQICGATQKEAPLHCHHIEGYTQNPRLGNDVTNTITLCKTCHKGVHKLPGCSYYESRCPTD